MPRSISAFTASILVGNVRTYRNSELMQIIMGLTDWMLLKKQWIQGKEIMGLSEEMIGVVESNLVLDG